jgi:hypothetical protein
MSQQDAEHMTAEYLMRKIEAEPMPYFISSAPVQDGPEYVEPLRFVAGALVVAVIAGLVFWVL